MNKPTYRKLRQQSNVTYIFKNPESLFLIDVLKNEIKYLRYLMTVDNKMDSRKQNAIMRDIEQSETIIDSMANE